jgi:hypothetical protein
VSNEGSILTLTIQIDGYNIHRFHTHFAKTMQKIEVTGTIDQQGYIQLDHPLIISDRKNVRIIILVAETDEDNDYDEPDESILAGLRQALSEVKAGQTIPLSELWDGIDV